MSHKLSFQDLSRRIAGFQGALEALSSAQRQSKDPADIGIFVLNSLFFGGLDMFGCADAPIFIHFPSMLGWAWWKLLPRPPTMWPAAAYYQVQRQSRKATFKNKLGITSKLRIIKRCKKSRVGLSVVSLTRGSMKPSASSRVSSSGLVGAQCNRNNRKMSSMLHSAWSCILRLSFVESWNMLKVCSKKAPKQINHCFFDPPIHLPRATLEHGWDISKWGQYMPWTLHATNLSTRSRVGASAGRDGSTGVLPGLLISTFESQQVQRNQHFQEMRDASWIC